MRNERMRGVMARSRLARRVMMGTQTRLQMSLLSGHKCPTVMATIKRARVGTEALLSSDEAFVLHSVAQAQTALAFLADPARQAAFLASYEAAPAAGQGGPANGPAAAAIAGPATPDHERAALVMDDGFWADHLVALRRRFDDWLDAK